MENVTIFNAEFPRLIIKMRDKISSVNEYLYVRF